MIRSLLFLMFLLGCSQEEIIKKENDQQQQKQTQQDQPKINPPITPVKRKICSIVKTTEIDDCLLYTLSCDDNNNELVLQCPIRNYGQLTNPPRPL